MKDNGFEILPVPYGKINLEKLLEQAVYYLPPFEKNEKGFKDAVIAETVFLAIESFDKKATKIFVCQDEVLCSYIASQNKELHISKSIKDLESRLRADIQKIGNIDELVNQADELFYIELHDITFFRQEDFRSYIYKKFPEVLKGISFSYETTGSISETEKYFDSIHLVNGEALKIKGNPFFVKKEGDVFFWESNVAIGRNFSTNLDDIKIEYDINFIVRWKAELSNSKLLKLELIEVKYVDYTVIPDVSSIFSGITNFRIYPSTPKGIHL